MFRNFLGIPKNIWQNNVSIFTNVHMYTKSLYKTKQLYTIKTKIVLDI